MIIKLFLRPGFNQSEETILFFNDWAGQINDTYLIAVRNNLLNKVNKYF